MGVGIDSRKVEALARGESYIEDIPCTLRAWARPSRG
jgi:hypothetical protein